MKKRWLYPIALVLSILLLAGCTSKELYESYQQYKDAYVRATAFIEEAEAKPDADSETVLAAMDPDAMEQELKTMQSALDKMKQTANYAGAKGATHDADLAYKDLQWLLYARKNIDKLSNEEQTDVGSLLRFASTQRADIISGDIDR